MPTISFPGNGGRGDGGDPAADQESAPEVPGTMEPDANDDDRSEDEETSQENLQESEEKEDENFLVMPSQVPSEKKNAYTGNVPPPPVELYHRAQAQVIEMVDGKSISYIKISYKKSLKNMKGQLVSAGKLIQELFGYLQKSSDTLMLTPIGNRENFIDQPIHVSYTLEREEVRGVFVVRSEKSLWHLKQNPIVK